MIFFLGEMRKQNWLIIFKKWQVINEKEDGFGGVFGFKYFILVFFNKFRDVDRIVLMIQF